MKRIDISLRQIFAVTLLISTFSSFLIANQFETLKLAFNYWDPLSITEFRLRHLMTAEFVAAIEQSLADGDIENAQEMVKIAQTYGHTIPTKLVEQTQENLLVYSVRNTSDFVEGAIYGQSTSFPSLLGAIAADYVGVGDVRDISIQGANLVSGADYDSVTLGVALVGLATVAPGSGPLDAGASLVKTANKAGRLSKPLVKNLKNMMVNLIDTAALRKGLAGISMPKPRMPTVATFRELLRTLDMKGMASGDFSSAKKIITEAFPIDTKALKNSLGSVIRPSAAHEAEELISATGTVASAGGIKATLAALEYSDDARELARFGQVAKSYRKRTGAIIEILGKSAIELGKLAYKLLAIALAAISWLFGVVWTIWLFLPQRKFSAAVQL